MLSGHHILRDFVAKFSSSKGINPVRAYALAVALAFPVASTADEIRIAGTGNALGTMKLIAKAYNKTYPQNKAVVLESLGSSGGIRAVTKGGVEIGLSSRPLTEKEKQLGLTATEYAQSPTVFAVRMQSKTTAITVNDILAIYSGKFTHWLDGTLVRPVLRQPGEDNNIQIMKLSPEMESSLKRADARPGMPFAITDQDAANKMESIPGSIGVSTLSLIISEKRALRPLILNGVTPTPENARTGRYPMMKPYYFVLPKNPSPAAMQFIDFLHSASGRSLLKRNGHTLP